MAEDELDNDAIHAVLSRARAAIAQSNALTGQVRCSQILLGLPSTAQPALVRRHSQQAGALIPDEGRHRECSGCQTSPVPSHDSVQHAGLTSRLAALSAQHSSTLGDLFSLRLQQLNLRKRQVSALQSLILAQVNLLLSHAETSVAQMVVRVHAAPACQSLLRNQQYQAIAVGTSNQAKCI